MQTEPDSATTLEPECLVRYGLTGRVGWFSLDLKDAQSLTRGETVTVRTRRGVELGESLTVVLEGQGRAGEDALGVFRVLRRAEEDDFALADEAHNLRTSRFELCRRIVEEESWPLELVDVEPLLDLGTVLHVLTFAEIDPALIRARFRMACDFDVFLEDLNAEPAQDATDPPASTGRCGDCDCGGGGCSRKASKNQAQASKPSPCSTTDSKGCSSCSVAAWKEKAAVAERSGGRGLGD